MSFVGAFERKKESGSIFVGEGRRGASAAKGRMEEGGDEGVLAVSEGLFVFSLGLEAT